MKPPPEKPIRLGSGHCCACASTCNHIAEATRLCQMHQQMETGRPMPTDDPGPIHG